jgi:hypothetical protein
LKQVKLYMPPDSPDLRIFISFSMGKSSAEMARLILLLYPLAQKIVVTANTSREAEASLVFGEQVDRHLAPNVALVEAVVHHGTRASCTHRLVTWKSAHRKGEVFEEVIKKYGLANRDWLHCTRELKTNPMYDYVDQYWERGSYWVAMGMRADEPKRLAENAKERRIMYPLAHEGITKADVNEEWGTFSNGIATLGRQPFTLMTEERWGNCVDCHKKSDAKHVLNIRENPSAYDFTREMEKYASINPKPGLPDRKIFRGGRTVADMFALAGAIAPDPRMLNRPDEDAGCAEHCEMEVLA